MGANILGGWRNEEMFLRVCTGIRVALKYQAETAEEKDRQTTS